MRVCVRRYLYESLLVLRKVALILIAALVSDPVVSTLLSLGATVVLWALTVSWKPFAYQMVARSLLGVTLVQQVCACPRVYCPWLCLIPASVCGRC